MDRAPSGASGKLVQGFGALDDGAPLSQSLVALICEYGHRERASACALLRRVSRPQQEGRVRHQEACGKYKPMKVCVQPVSGGEDDVGESMDGRRAANANLSVPSNLRARQLQGILLRSP